MDLIDIRIWTSLSHEGSSSFREVFYRKKTKTTLFIPGQERHIGMKEDLRLNLDFNPADRAKFNTVAIQTPPRVLTLEDRPFPSVDDELRSRPKVTPRQFSGHHNGVMMSNSPRYYSFTIHLRHNTTFFIIGNKGRRF